MEPRTASSDPPSPDLGVPDADASANQSAPYDPSAYNPIEVSDQNVAHLQQSHDDSYSHQTQQHVENHPVGIDMQQHFDEYQRHAQMQAQEQSPDQQQQQQQQLSHQQQLQHEQQQPGVGQTDNGVGYQSQQLQSYKVFCGGLSFQTDEDKLREYFERLGTVVDVVIMRDRSSGHPRGFGFVSFAEEAVAKDVASRRHDIDGRQVEAKIAIPRNQVSHPVSGGMRNGAPRHTMDGVPSVSNMGGNLPGPHGSSRSNTSHLNKIFVGGLPSQVGEAEFSAYFSQFGEVTDAQVMIDHQTGNSRGFGFISFADQASVEVVVGPGRSSTRHEIMGKTVEVKRAEPKGSTSGGDRRSRDGYGSAGGQRNQYVGGHGAMVGMPGVGATPTNNTSAAGGAAANAAGTGAYAGYNYPASIMEQYGAYYNNPQWQQFYAAMGYNMSAYPQGYNPYTFYAAYMNNASAVNAAGDGADSVASGGNVPADSAGGVGGMEGGGQSRGGGNGGGSSGYGPPGNGSSGAGAGAGPGSRRSSRREDRYHPYR